MFMYMYINKKLFQALKDYKATQFYANKYLNILWCSLMVVILVKSKFKTKHRFKNVKWLNYKSLIYKRHW